MVDWELLVWIVFPVITWDDVDRDSCTTLVVELLRCTPPCSTIVVEENCCEGKSFWGERSRGVEGRPATGLPERMILDSEVSLTWTTFPLIIRVADDLDSDCCTALLELLVLWTPPCSTMVVELY